MELSEEAALVSDRGNTRWANTRIDAQITH